MPKVFNNRYNVLRKLGEGSLGDVYLVEDYLQSGRSIALKTISPGCLHEDVVEHFKREFDLMCRLKHPNLVQVYDFDSDPEDGIHFITMEYAGNKTLQDVLDRRVKLPLDEAVSILIDLCRTLAYIHSRGVLHRDVKPANIIIHRNQTKLMDFGLATLDPTPERQRRATIRYMAPEVLRGNAGLKADIFSAGVTFYHALTGDSFYRCENSRSILELVQDDRQFERNQRQILEQVLSPGVRKVIAGMTALDPRERTGSATEVIDSLNRNLGLNYEFESRETRRAYVMGAGFVGRKVQLERLEESLQQGGLTVVRGASGSGRTRLFEEFRRHCRLRKIPFVKGDCLENFARSYNPFMEILSDVILRVPEECLNRYGSDLRRLLPGNRQLSTMKSPEPLESIAERNLLVELIPAFLLEWAESTGTPVALSIHDLQWADELTLETLSNLLELLGDADPPINLMVSVSIQSDRPAGIPSILESLRFTGPRDDIVLSAFTPAEGIEFFEAVFGHDAVGPLLRNAVDSLVSLVEGNPLFLKEAVRILVNRNSIIRRRQDWELIGPLESAAIPRSRQEIVRERIKDLELSPQEDLTLQLLAILDRGVSIDEFQFILADRVDLSVRDFFQKLEDMEILRTDVVEGTIQFHFIDALLPKVLIADLAEVSGLHLFIAERLERLYGHRIHDFIEELAYHYGRSSHKDRAIVYLEKAGNKAKKEYAHEKAMLYFDRLLELLPAGETRKRVEILLCMTEILELIGHWQDGENLCRRCIILTEEHGLKDLTAKTRQHLGQLFRVRGDYEAAFRSYREAYTLFQAMRDSASSARIISDMGNIYWSTGNYEEAMKCYFRLLDAAREDGDLQGISLALNNIGNVHLRRCDYQTAMKHYEQKLQIDRQSGNRRGETNVLTNIGLVHRLRGEFNQARQCLERALQLAAETGDRRAEGIAIGNLGNVQLAEREFHEARESFSRWLQLARSMGDKRGISNAIGSLGSVSLQLGHLGQAHKCFTGTLKLARKQGDRLNICLSIGQIGRVFAAQRRLDLAEEHFDRSIALGRELDFKSFLFEMLHEKAILLFDQGNLVLARQFNDEAISIAEGIKEFEAIFELSLLSEKIRYHQAHNDAEKAEIVTDLKNIMVNCNDDLRVALILEVIFSLTGQRDSGLKARELLGCLAEKTGLFDLSQKHARLTHDLEIQSTG